MKATQKLHELGQSVWLDNITRDLLTSGTLKRYIAEESLWKQPKLPRLARGAGTTNGRGRQRPGCLSPVSRAACTRPRVRATP